jgi:hypothetical protein
MVEKLANIVALLLMNTILDIRVIDIECKKNDDLIFFTLESFWITTLF